MLDYARICSNSLSLKNYSNFQKFSGNTYFGRVRVLVPGLLWALRVDCVVMTEAEVPGLYE